MANRSNCLLKQFLLEDALLDCDKVIEYVDQKKKGNAGVRLLSNYILGEDYFEKLKTKILARKAMIYSMQGHLSRGTELLKSVLEQKDKLTEAQIQQIEHQIAKIEQRIDTNAQKVQLT